MTVLVVADEPAVREVTRRMLERNGYCALAAGTFDDAFAIAHHEPIDVAIIDAVMPQLLGKDVADQIRKLHPQVRVLYMSGYTRPALTSLGTLAEDVALLEKPFTEQALLAKIREVLED